MTIGSDGSNPVVIAGPITPRRRFIDGTPAWSPDGTQIAVAASKDLVKQLLIVNVDGSGVENISGRHDDNSADWSPDGTKIAFSTAGDGLGDESGWPRSNDPAHPRLQLLPHRGRRTAPKSRSPARTTGQRTPARRSRWNVPRRRGRPRTSSSGATRSRSGRRRLHRVVGWHPAHAFSPP
jgi:hypothetical protein